MNFWVLIQMGQNCQILKNCLAQDKLTDNMRSIVKFLLNIMKIFII
jgi:hypothetical protein